MMIIRPNLEERNAPAYSESICVNILMPSFGGGWSNNLGYKSIGLNIGLK